MCVVFLFNMTLEEQKNQKKEKEDNAERPTSTPEGDLRRAILDAIVPKKEEGDDA